MPLNPIANRILHFIKDEVRGRQKSELLLALDVTDSGKTS